MFEEEMTVKHSCGKSTRLVRSHAEAHRAFAGTYFCASCGGHHPSKEFEEVAEEPEAPVEPSEGHEESPAEPEAVPEAPQLGKKRKKVR